jgi:WD40 repeat protein
LFVVISDILVVYNSETGDVITKPTKAAKEPINCVAFSKDGRTFATASYLSCYTAMIELA